jgi:hypothetical protein
LTLPTHPVAVLPLKLWRPHWFDGVALTIGAIAPDIGYAVESYGVPVHSHAWPAPLWWAVPVSWIGCRVVRWAAPVVAAHLPAGGPLQLRDYGVLGRVRHPWYVTVWSAVLGAVSHIVWDAFTHPYVDGPRLLFPWLHEEVWPGRPWWDLISDGSDLIGFAAGAWLAVSIGRARLLRRWYGPPPETAARPAVFWPAVLLALGIGLAALPLRPAQLLPDQAVRVLLVAVLSLVAATAVVRGLIRGPDLSRSAPRDGDRSASR